MIRALWLCLLGVVFASVELSAIEAALPVDESIPSTAIRQPSVTDVTLLLAASLASQARTRLTSADIPPEIPALITQIISISLAASADPETAKTLVKEAALKSAAVQLLVLQAALPAPLQDAVDKIADLGLAVVAQPSNAANFIREAALAYAKEKTGATGDAVADEIYQLLTRGQNAEAFSADVTLLLMPTALSAAKTRLPSKYHEEIDVLGSLAQRVARDPHSAQAALKEAAELAASKVVDLVEARVGQDAGRAVDGLVSDLRTEYQASTNPSGSHLGLGPAELQLTNWGKVTRALLRCVPFCNRITHGRVKGEAGEALSMVGDVVVDLSAKTLLQFMYFDMRSEMVEASKALVAINKQTKSRTFATYKAYSSEQLAQDLNHFVVQRIGRVLGEYEVRKKQDVDSVTLLDSLVPLGELKKLRSQLDVFLNEDQDGDLMPEWPKAYAVSKRVVDHVAVMLEEVMAVEVQGGCVFACCGGYWVKGKKGANDKVVPAGQTAVSLKVNHDDGLGRAATKVAAVREAAKVKHYSSVAREDEN